MNLINCDKPCEYKKDDYCGLNKIPDILNKKIDTNNCVYFKKKVKNPIYKKPLSNS